jgi:hypothetical protein
MEIFSTEGTYLERFLYYFKLNPFDLPPEVDKSWDFASYVYVHSALYLFEFKTFLPDNLSGVKSWINDNRNLWEYYGYTVGQKYSTPLYRSIKGDLFGEGFFSKAILQNPSFFLLMGFSNLKQFYAYASFICAWIYSIDNTNISAKNAGMAFINMYTFGAVDEKERSLWETPVTDNTEKLESFSGDLMDYLSHYLNIIEPLFSSSTSSVRSFNAQMITDAEDTIALAGETKFFKKEESNDDILKIGIGIALAIGAISLLRR